eukprot:Lankesteria_metandrocarpae@DN3541_c0_g1_i1.p1
MDRCQIVIHQHRWPPAPHHQLPLCKSLCSNVIIQCCDSNQLLQQLPTVTKVDSRLCYHCTATSLLMSTAGGEADGRMITALYIITVEVTINQQRSTTDLVMTTTLTLSVVRSASVVGSAMSSQGWSPISHLCFL